jgi:O-acetylhomoserine (thiol)-lyase
VRYPGLPGDTAHARASRYLRHFGSVLTFGVKGGIDGARQFMNHLRILQAPNIGDSRTLAVHPWTTTHAKLGEPARLAAGVKPELIRFSVGLESAADLEAILQEALGAVEISLSR